MESKFNGRNLRKKICQGLGIRTEDYENFLIKLYNENMSGAEISELIERETEVVISPRSIQRIVAKSGKMRTVKEAFGLAMGKGRVVWQLEEDKKRREGARHQVAKRMRYEVMKRDGFKCVLCGSKELLQIDHRVARMNDGLDTFENLRTLCLECNIGNAQTKKEYVQIGGFKSGK